MSMIDETADYREDFKDTYGRHVEFPTTNLLWVNFHPTLMQHVVTVNEITFPDGDMLDVTSLMNERISGNFDSRIRDEYMEEAKYLVARRRNKMVENLNIQRDSEDDSLPSEPEDSAFEEEEDYEGGKEDEKEEEKKQQDSKESESAKPKKPQSSKSLQLEGPKKKRVTGSYPKGQKGSAMSKVLAEKTVEWSAFNKAVDMYLEDHNTTFAYQDLDESLILEKNDDDAEHVDDFVPDERVDAFKVPPPWVIHPQFITWSEVPEYENMKYIPPLFREKYEI